MGTLVDFCKKFDWKIDGHCYQTPGLVTLYHNREKYGVRLLIEIKSKKIVYFLKGWRDCNQWPDKPDNPEPKHILFFAKEEAADLLAINDWSLPPRNGNNSKKDIHNDA